MGLCWSEPPTGPTHPTGPLQPTPLQQPIQTQSPMYVQRTVQPIPQYQVYTQYPLVPTNQFIQINVKTLTGNVIPITLYLSETIYQLKQRIQFVMGVPPERQVLIYMGKQLEDNKYVFYYSITTGVTLNLVLRM
jgi:hypothetical protein